MNEAPRPGLITGATDDDPSEIATGGTGYQAAPALVFMRMEIGEVSETALDAQNDFLEAHVADGKVVWVFLINGVRLTGAIASFDTHTLRIESPNGAQLVYKHAIATVCEPCVAGKVLSSESVGRDRSRRMKHSATELLLSRKTK